MIKLGKELGHAVALGHISGDFFAARMIVHMSIGIDDLHEISLLVLDAGAAGTLRAALL
jgi:hypothetical protein